jgi:hypothetical protein
MDEKMRFPCYVFLDEAHNFLPQQEGIAPISEGTAKMLDKAFFKICNQGRAYGFTTAFFTQRIANIKKWVIANCQVKVIMKHGLDVDLNRCEQEVGKNNASREQIEKLGKGEGIVLGWGMKPFKVKFHMRDSYHPSSTPDIKRARAFYAGNTGEVKTEQSMPQRHTQKGNVQRLSMPQQVRGYQPYTPTGELRTMPREVQEALVKAARQAVQTGQLQGYSAVAQGYEDEDEPHTDPLYETETVRMPSNVKPFMRAPDDAEVLRRREQTAAMPQHWGTQQPAMTQRQAAAYHRPSPTLPKHLQEALDAFEPGMSYRHLGEVLNIGKDAAGQRIQELRRRKLIS